MKGIRGRSLREEREGENDPITTSKTNIGILCNINGLIEQSNSYFR